MTKAIRIHGTGGPEVLRYEDVEVGDPGPGQVKVRLRAIRLNFIDTYHRTGLYKMEMPFVPGVEGAGDVTAVGEGVTDFKPGDRVGVNIVGNYAEERLAPAGKLVPLPDGIDYDTAAAVMSKGGTAYYLLHQTYPVGDGDTMLVHAAAGGVGSFLAQWGRALGAQVLGTSGSAEKVALARANGCMIAWNSRADDWVKGVRDATGGEGVDVVYDGVGQATFERSLDCLRPRSLMVTYGNASGAVSVPTLGILATKGSLYVTRPTTAHYQGTPELLRAAMAEVFKAVASGVLRVAINQRFPLEKAADAHRALEARETTGATVILP